MYLQIYIMYLSSEAILKLLGNFGKQIQQSKQDAEQYIFCETNQEPCE